MRDKNYSGGIGTLGVIQIVLIILKLTNLIQWKWSVVLIPLWINLTLIVIGLIYIFVSLNRW